MHQIWKELVQHVKDDYSPRSYLLTGLFLTLLLFGNYYFEFKNDFFKGISNWSYLWFNGAVFFLSYYGAVLIKSGTAPFKNKDFLISSFAIVSIATLSSSLLFARVWVSGFSQMEQYYVMRILFNSLGSIVVFVGLGILFYVQDKGKVDGFYGLSIRKKHNYLPYFGLLLLMLPLLIGASSQPHFLDTYPMFKANRYQSVFGLSLQQMTAIYESFYLLDFIRVELIFRGALIIGLSRFLGKDVVLPMVVIYCMLHINKPLGEAISSIFGGYLLGVIALYQRHIIGGCIAHIGIAGLMELLAYIASS